MVTPEAVEAARKVMARGAYQMSNSELPYEHVARAALEAAAQHMLAEALEEEAEGLSWLGAQGNTVEPDTAWAGVQACRDILRRRAAEMRAK